MMQTETKQVLFSRTIRDGRLVGQALAGHTDAFEALVRRYLPVVHATAYAYTGNHTDAEDVAQEAFLAAYQSLDKLREADRFGAWLVGITKNLCGRVTRAARRNAEIRNHHLQGEEVVVPDMEKKEMQELVWHRVQELEEDSREVLMLHYFAGKNANEIAGLLSLTPEARGGPEAAATAS